MLEGRIPHNYDQISTYTINRRTILRSEFTGSDQLKAHHVGHLQSFTIIRGGEIFLLFFIFNHVSFPTTFQTHRHNFLSSV